MDFGTIGDITVSRATGRQEVYVLLAVVRANGLIACWKGERRRGLFILRLAMSTMEALQQFTK